MTELAFTNGQVVEIVTALIASNVVITFLAVALSRQSGFRAGEKHEREQWQARIDRNAYRQEKGIDR